MYTFVKELLIVFILSTVFTNTIQANSFTIYGQVEEKHQGQSITLESLNFLTDQYNQLASSSVSNKNQFSFSCTFNEPSIYRLKIGNEIIQLAIDGAQDLHLKLRDGKWNTTGSKGTTQMNDFPSTLAHWQEKYFGQMKKDLAIAMEADDKAEIAAIEQSIPKQVALFKGDFHQYIENMKYSAGVYVVLQYWDRNKDQAYVEEVWNRFINKAPHWSISKKFAKELVALKSLSIGKVAPDFKGKDRDGTPFQLSAMRGNYVLIEFWASWCQACRIENPKLVKVYQNYHSKGFEVVGITRDEKQLNWEKAIEKDALPWPQLFKEGYPVLELYQVNSLPQNVLLDKKGQIIAKNINAAALEKILVQAL